MTWLVGTSGQLEESDSTVQGRYPGVAPSRALGSHFSSSVAKRMEGRGQGQIHLNKAQLSPEGLTDLIPRVLPCYLMAVCSRDFPVGVRPLSVEFRAGKASKGLPGPHWSPHHPPLVSMRSQEQAATSGNTMFTVASAVGHSHSGHRE